MQRKSVRSPDCSVVCLALAWLAACASDTGAPAQRDRPGMSASAGASGGTASTQAGAQAEAPAQMPMLLPPVNPNTDTPSPMPACASAEVHVTRVTPRVWLLVDGSGSMAAALDNSLAGTSRWSVLRDALLADGTGLVSRLQGVVEFGLYVYDGGLSLPGMAGPQCPRAIVSEPALNNAAAMSGVYPAAQTGASTPTHYALLDLKKRIDAAGASPNGPTYVVLATDGKPNLCDFHDGIPATPDTEREAVDTVAQLSAAGTHVFVISMAGADVDLQTHLMAVAAAGKTGTQPFTPTSQDDLAKALTQIIGATASCDVRIQGRVEVGRECTGTVTMNGAPLLCNDANGYRLKPDRQSLELLGSACNALQSAAAPIFRATFPCRDVVLL